MKRTPSIWSEHHGKDNFIAEYPEYSMFAMLNNVAKKHPDYTALEFEDKKISFTEMIEYIEQISKALLASGIKKGDYVSIEFNCIEDQKNRETEVFKKVKHINKKPG